MKLVFVDTSGWTMLADTDDRDHAAAVRFRDQWMKAGGAFVTTDYIVDETLTLLRMRLGLDAAERWLGDVSLSPRVRWEGIGPDRAEKARAWLFRWREHEFSFTDCTSFVVMRELRLTQALAKDRHFVVAGFEMVPSPPRRRRKPLGRNTKRK